MSCLAYKRPPDSFTEGNVDFRSVLIVDDDEELRRMVAFTLKIADFIVLESCNGKQALEIAENRNGPIDVLLTDLQMPEMDGLSLAGKLTADRPSVKVLLMSGHLERDEKWYENRPHGMEFIEKPFTPRMLINRVRAILREVPS
jgi:DNA-binding response OmpR family regulator